MNIWLYYVYNFEYIFEYNNWNRKKNKTKKAFFCELYLVDA